MIELQEYETIMPKRIAKVTVNRKWRKGHDDDEGSCLDSDSSEHSYKVFMDANEETLLWKGIVDSNE